MALEPVGVIKTVKDIGFGELAEDSDFVSKCVNLELHLTKVKEVLDKILPLKDDFDKLPNEQQIEIDLFLAYAMNSLMWIYMRLGGADISNHPIKRELDRVKEATKRWNEVKDRKLRPKVDVEVAKRFVRSGLYDHMHNRDGAPPNKKIRFEDSD